MDILAVRGDEGRLLENDMLRGVLKHALNRRFPNGATRIVETLFTPC
jgi:hypothetical protein